MESDLGPGLISVPAGTTPEMLKEMLFGGEPGASSIKRDVFGRPRMRCRNCGHFGPVREHHGFAYCGKCHGMIRRIDGGRSVKDEADKL